MKAKKDVFLFIFFSILIVSCGGSSHNKTPLDNLIKQLNDVPTYSIVLYDMDVEGTFFNTYKQQYQVLKSVGDSVKTNTTPWYEVNEATFLKYKEDMGMTIISKTNGVLKKAVSPAGYANYVGNSKYGHWSTNSSGGSFWEFYGKYAFMTSMFNMMSYPVRRSYYNDYHSNYYSRNRPYYGPTVNNRRYYGTNGTYNSRRATTSNWGKRTQGFTSNSFKNKVQNRTSRSGSNSRSSTRGSSSTYRSRGGGFGK